MQPTGNFTYSVNFENEASATAPAQTVTVTEQLDPNLDWNTFQFGDIGFGNFTISVPPGRTSFSTRLDATATLGVFVDVSANFNLKTGAITWTFTALDPKTLDLPSDPTAGFLPPNTNAPEGQGFVSYTVNPKAALATGTKINAQATVVFDTNAPINTAPMFNTIDNSPPTSSVNPLPATVPAPNFTVNWSGSDPKGPGIAYYNVYVSDNGGTFTLWQKQTTQTSATYNGVKDHTYAFYSVAADPLGLTQPTPTSAQATTTVNLVPPTSTVSALPSSSPASFTLTWSGSAATGLTIASYTVYVSDNGGAYTALLSDTTKTSTTFTGVNGHTYRFYSVATDSGSNVEPTPSAAQATTTVDILVPTSRVTALPAFSPGSITLSWSGSDNSGGSGVASYSIFVSDDGGAFSSLLTNTTKTSTTFKGADGHTYGFYSIATDEAGNVQATPTSAQTTTTGDATPPTSSVASLPAFSAGPFSVNWSGSDGKGSGVAFYSVYVSDNGAAFTLWQNQTTQTSATYTGVNGHTYGFYSIATDKVGNVQATPTSTQATTTVDTAPPTSSVNPLLATVNTASFNVSWSGSDAKGSGIASYTIYVSDNGGAFTPWLTKTAQTSATYTGQFGHHYRFYSVATDALGLAQPTPTAAQATTDVFVPSPPPTPPPSPPPHTAPPAPPAPPTLQVPPLLALLDSLLGGVETVNANGTETIADSIFGIPLFVSTYNSAGDLIGVTVFGINVTSLFE